MRQNEEKMQSRTEVKEGKNTKELMVNTIKAFQMIAHKTFTICQFSSVIEWVFFFLLSRLVQFIQSSTLSPKLKKKNKAGYTGADVRVFPLFDSC